MSFAIPQQPKELGLSSKEKQSYSLLTALSHLQKGDWSKLGKSFPQLPHKLSQVRATAGRQVTNRTLDLTRRGIS